MIEFEFLKEQDSANSSSILHPETLKVNYLFSLQKTG